MDTVVITGNFYIVVRETYKSQYWTCSDLLIEAKGGFVCVWSILLLAASIIQYLQVLNIIMVVQNIEYWPAQTGNPSTIRVASVIGFSICSLFVLCLSVLYSLLHFF